MAATYPLYLQSITIRAGVNDVVVFNQTLGDISATIAPGTYYLRGNGTATDFAFALKFAMDSVAVGATFSVTPEFAIDGTQNEMQIFVSSGLFRFNLSTSTFDLSLLGFNAANEVYASGQVGADGMDVAWVGNQPLSGRELQRASDVVQNITADGQAYTYVQQSALALRTLEHELIGADYTFGTGPSFERWWELARDGRPFEAHAQTATGGIIDALSPSTLFDTLVMAEDSCRAFTPARLSRGLALYSWALLCRRWVA